MNAFDEQVWEERYRSQPAIWSKQPNPQLVAEAGGLPPGSALDAGCGEGSDACWLASRGWRVTAVDISGTALERGAAKAEALGADIAGRIDWVRADLTEWDVPEGRFDLVSAQFLHMPPEPREALFARLAAAVAPGGTLLIVGHDFSDTQSGVHRPHTPEVYFTAEQVASSLDAGRWDAAADTRPREAADSEGRAVTIHDAVVRARRI